jgi:hypothetical protein
MTAPNSFHVRPRAVIPSCVLVPAWLLLLALACSTPATPVIEVTADPAAVEVAPGGSVRLQATVTGTEDTRLSWEVTSGQGTVDEEGVYTAPAQEGQARVRATSVVDPAAFSYVLVTVRTPPLPLSLQVLPGTRKIGVQSSTLFTTQLTNGTGKEQFDWVLEEGAQAGHFNVVNGLSQQKSRIYVAPSTPGTYHLTVNVTGKPEVSARATVTVTAEVPAPTLRGTIHYSGQKTGPVYVLYALGDESGNTLVPQVSTRIEGPGAYQLTPILGSSMKSSFVVAFMDTHGSGWLNVALDPMVIIPFYPTGEDQVLELTLAEPSPDTTLRAMSAQLVAAGIEDRLLVFFGGSRSTQGLQGELADSYTISWTPTGGGGGTMGSLTVPAGRGLPEYGQIVAVPGVAPGLYSVSVTPRRGNLTAAGSSTAQPARVGGSPQGTGATLSGQVVLEAPTASGSIYVGIQNVARIFQYTRVPATSSSVSWSIPNLPAGEYMVWALLDADGDGFPERAVPSADALASVTVSGTGTISAPVLSFVDAQPVLVRSTTFQQTPYYEEGMAQEGGLFYSISFLAGGRRPVAVRLTGAGQGVPLPYDLAGNFAAPASGSPLPKTPLPFKLNLDPGIRWTGLSEGTPLTAELINNDGSSEQVPLAAPRVLPIPELKTPVNNATTDFSPVFTWALPAGLPSTDKLSFQLVNTKTELPVSQTSFTFNGSNGVFAKYRTYTWTLEVSDGKGNLSRAWDRFYVGLP